MGYPMVAPEFVRCRREALLERSRTPLTLRSAPEGSPKGDSSGTSTKSAEIKELAPRPGLEPGTLRLTAECSTIELPRNDDSGFITRHTRNGNSGRGKRCFARPPHLSAFRQHRPVASQHRSGVNRFTPSSLVRSCRSFPVPRRREHP